MGRQHLKLVEYSFLPIGLAFMIFVLWSGILEIMFAEWTQLIIILGTLKLSSVVIAGILYFTNPKIRLYVSNKRREFFRK